LKCWLDEEFAGPGAISKTEHTLDVAMKLSERKNIFPANVFFCSALIFSNEFLLQ
jgi:hypothetical protein